MNLESQSQTIGSPSVVLHGLVMPQSYTSRGVEVEITPAAEEPTSVRLTLEEMNTVAKLSAYPPPPNAELLQLFGCKITAARRVKLALKKWWYDLWFSAA